MGSKSGAAIGYTAGTIAMGPLGGVAGAIYGSKKDPLKNPAPPDPALENRNRLKGLLAGDNLDYLDAKEKEEYMKKIANSPSSMGISPQDELNFYKTNADELEKIIANRREKAKLYAEQAKLLAEMPGAKQFNNPDYLLQAALKNPESILTAGAGDRAASNAAKGSILT